MARFTSCLAGLAATAALSIAALPAGAQFGSIFGDPPPRPPQPVPRGSAPQQTQPPDFQQPQRAPAPIQSQPLPAPPGVPQAEPDPPAQTNRMPAGQPPGQPPLQGLPPGQRQPRGAAQTPDATLQPGDEVITEPPAQKLANPGALFSGLDKITGRIINFDVTIGETVQFGALQVTPRACYTRPVTETQNTDAFIEVDEVTLQGDVRRIFTGWMFASSPGLNAVEHPIYDIWLTDCKRAAVAEAPAEPQPAAQPARPAQPAAKRPAQQTPAQQAPAGQAPPRR
jgi:hypothetical protein